MQSDLRSREPTFYVELNWKKEGTSFRPFNEKVGFFILTSDFIRLEKMYFSRIKINLIGYQMTFLNVCVNVLKVVIINSLLSIILTMV